MTLATLLLTVLLSFSAENVQKVGVGQRESCPSGPLLMLVTVPIVTTRCTDNTLGLNGLVSIYYFFNQVKVLEFNYTQEYSLVLQRDDT